MGDNFCCATPWVCLVSPISVVAHSPRLLAVGIRSNMVSAEVIVTHAPCEESPDAPRHWQMLRRLIAGRARQDVPLLMCVDANGTTGCETSSAVGPTRADPQTDSGTTRHSCRLAWLPRTLPCSRTPRRVVRRGGLRSLGPVLGASIFLPCLSLGSLASRRPALSLPSIYVLPELITSQWSCAFAALCSSICTVPSKAKDLRPDVAQ